MSKYGSKKAQADGFTFDSTVERDRYLFLRLLEKAGEIQVLQLQTRFRLNDKFRRNGKVYLESNYIPDFCYYEG